MADEGATSLSAADVKNVSDDIAKYSDEADAAAKSVGIDTKIVGNDPGELTKAAGAGAALAAGIAAPISVAAGPFAPLVIGAAAIIGAIAGFFAKFHFGPSPEAVALSKEFDQLVQTITAILATVPEPYRTRLSLVIRNSLKRRPGPLWFCLGPGAGCAMTSIQGLRDTAASLKDQVHIYLSANEPQPVFTRRRVGIGLALAAVVAVGAYAYREKRP